MFDKEFMEAFTFLKVYHYFADGDGKSVWTNHVKQADRNQVVVNGHCFASVKAYTFL